MDWHTELEVARELVAEAAVQVRRAFYSQQLGSRVKADGTPVTDADLAAENLIRDGLAARLPDDLFYGEESASTSDMPSGRVWVVDAIDGTSNALTHVNPTFMVAVSLVADGAPVVAVIESPITGQRFTATKDGGAFLEHGQTKARLHVGDAAALPGARILVGIGSSTADAEWLGRIYPKLLSLGNPSSPRHFGSSAFDLCLVAAGNLSTLGFDVKIDHGSQPWDLVGGALLVCEAGAEIADAMGEPWEISATSLIAANSDLVRAILPLVRGD